MLGFAARAGKTATGYLATETAVKKGKAGVVFYDEELSENTVKKLESLCENRNVTLLSVKEGVLQKTVGKENINVACITDKLFSGRIEELINNL